MGVAAASHYVVNVGRMSTFGNQLYLTFLSVYPNPDADFNSTCVVTEAGPTAYATIDQNYYYVFVGCCTVYLVLIYFYFPLVIPGILIKER